VVEPPPAERTERLSLRLPSALKKRVEASAALEGVSPNAWVERALSRSVDPRLLSS
jgi:predicted HicB family RNase H-like nuclease